MFKTHIIKFSQILNFPLHGPIDIHCMDNSDGKFLSFYWLGSLNLIQQNEQIFFSGHSIRFSWIIKMLHVDSQIPQHIYLLSYTNVDQTLNKKRTMI